MQSAPEPETDHTIVRRHRLTRAALWLVLALVTSAFFIDLCNAIYQCGCQSLWAGAASQCNIHRPIGPHCPWCALPAWMSACMAGSIVLLQAVVLYRIRRLILALIVAGAIFPLLGIVFGLVTGSLSGYW